MKYNQPYGVSDPNAPYINGNPATGTQGSIPPAASIEYPQRELANFFTDTGLTPSNSDLHQLSKAVMTGMVHHAIDAGPKNALSVNLVPVPDRYYDGMFIFVIVNISNDAAATINVNGLGVKNIVRRGGGPVLAGDLPGSYRSLLCYNAPHNNFELYGVGFAPVGGGGPGPGFLPVLTANTTWYINAAIGSDTLYDGTTPTISGPHGPFKTITRGVNEVFKYGPSVYTATLQVAAGTYTEGVSTPLFPGPQLVINGAGKTATFINSPTNVGSISVGGPNTMTVSNLCATINPSGQYYSIFYAGQGGRLYNQETASSGNASFAVFESFQGFIALGNHTFNAGSSFGYAISSFFGGYLGGVAGSVYTFAGGVTCNSAFATAGSNGAIQYGQIGQPGIPQWINPSYVGGPGPKYIVAANGVINSGGLGPNYFPGAAGSYQTTGGQYV